MDPNLTQQLDEFRVEAARVGEDTVFKAMPAKILELHAIITSMSSQASPFHVSHAASHTDTTVYPPPNTFDNGQYTTKKRKREGDSQNALPNGTGADNDTSHAIYPSLVAANKHQMQLQEVVKKEAQQLAEYIDSVKLWVNLTMPKIEDGDNFGVQVQEEVLNELHRAQESAYNIRDSGRVAGLTRAKIASKLIKYPHVEDYAIGLREHDEKQHQVAKQHIYDLRNVYAILTDIIHKNISKIRAPKANNHTTLY